MARLSLLLLSTALLSGCASSPVTIASPPTPEPLAEGQGNPKAEPSQTGAHPGPVVQVATSASPTEETPRESSTWIGAAPTSDFILRNQQETILGVWVDVPRGQAQARAKTAMALVIDTSGSMSGDKIVQARAAAHRMVDSMPDGDIVSIDSFSDSAEERALPQTLDANTRKTIHAAIDTLNAHGGTNLFEGLKMAELGVARAPSTHPVRRVVLISDGVATVGPTSTEILGSIAERGSDHGIQVTALGVGLDYDEKTLNTLAIRSSGRMHHIASPEAMASIIAEETRLFTAARATDAQIEVVPAPGVSIVSIAGARSLWGEKGSMKIPLGAMFSGQHREMAVRVRITDPSAVGPRPLASVRLHFKDPADQGLDRVQEVVARFELTDNPQIVASHENEKARTIAAVNEANEVAIAAAQDVNEGRFDEAAKKLAQAESKLSSVAGNVKDAKEKQRVLAVAKTVNKARTTSEAAAAAPAAAMPAPARRAKALEMNADAMHNAGF